MASTASQMPGCGLERSKELVLISQLAPYHVLGCTVAGRTAANLIVVIPSSGLYFRKKHTPHHSCCHTDADTASNGVHRDHITLKKHLVLSTWSTQHQYCSSQAAPATAVLLLHLEIAGCDTPVHQAAVPGLGKSVPITYADHFYYLCSYIRGCLKQPGPLYCCSS